MKKLAQFCSILLLAAGVVFAQGPGPGGRRPGAFGRAGGEGAFGMEFAGPGSRTPVTGAPYSGVQVTQFQQTLEGANQIARQGQSKVYRDSQGRVRIEGTAGPGAFHGQATKSSVHIFDPVAGYSHMLNPQNMTAVSMALPAPRQGASAEGRRPHEAGSGANAPQIVKEDLGTQTINGLAATGTRTTRTIPAGAIGNAQPIQTVREVWVSSDLKVPIMIKSSDPRFGTSVTQLTNITRAEPDASLFQVPAGYAVTQRTRPTPQQQ